ncbi:MAG: undecaprenyldiphospho-muramoylpentapeptide beta-N-acetylglucosaminyltransferase [Mogibacterium sp.]|nr:undecaprenyldiphospho-muramoylpentapeptide beta-N-acetylglucosaminyltransferase [Mogibacterium sp.]MBR2539585.1 undecaprenyldiphospho-muramoylpentapeptide beta-N-acetylglucosaminyltransferase [Mogibacterium sp.]
MRIVLTGGATGGHIYPALAIGDAFRERDPECEVIYIASGNSLEKAIIPDKGYTLYEVESRPLDRRNIKKIVSTLSGTLRGRSQALKIMKKFKPDVVFSTGSYVSVPVVLAGDKLGASIYLHEQNGFPGVSNRFLARFAKRVFLGFESAREHFADQDKIVYSGNPVRSEFSGRSRLNDRRNLGIPEDDFVIMVFGGSLGSEMTNAVGEAVAREYADKPGYTVIWGTGSMYFEDIQQKFAAEGFAPSNVRISAFIKNMPEMLSAADLSISRSGALSTAETTMEGRAAIFIPSPNVTADHQYYNAKAVADKGGAFIVRESESTTGDVLRIIRELDSDRNQIRQMEKASRSTAPVHAAEIIYNTIMETYR